MKTSTIFLFTSITFGVACLMNLWLCLHGQPIFVIGVLGYLAAAAANLMAYLATKSNERVQKEVADAIEAIRAKYD